MSNAINIEAGMTINGCLVGQRVKHLEFQVIRVTAATVFLQQIKDGKPFGEPKRESAKSVQSAFDMGIYFI